MVSERKEQIIKLFPWEKTRNSNNVQKIVYLLITFCLLLYMFSYMVFNGVQQTLENVNPVEESIRRVQRESKAEEGDIQQLIRDLFELGLKDVDAMLQALTIKDPFGLRVGPNSFVCPVHPSQRIDYPNIVNPRPLHRFIDEESDAWMFYQNIRSTGGEDFCTTAIVNMPRRTVPLFYCMPDFRGGEHQKINL